MILKIKFSYAKKYFCLAVFFLIVACGNKETKKYDPTKTNKFNTIIQFEKKNHNFEVIRSMDTIGTIFRFKNKGINPLVIQHVSSSCGCTIPEWPMNQIEPNGNGIIKVIYDAKEHGHFNKTISVFYNGKDSPIKLSIKGEVLYSIKLYVFKLI